MPIDPDGAAAIQAPLDPHPVDGVRPIGYSYGPIGREKCGSEARLERFRIAH